MSTNQLGIAHNQSANWIRKLITQLTQVRAKIIYATV